MLQTLTDEAGSCCRKEWEKKAEAGALDATAAFFCRRCGQEYRPTQHAGPVRAWVAHVEVVVFLPGAPK